MNSNVKHPGKWIPFVNEFFVQVSAEEFIDVPCSHPDIDQIISVVVDSEITSMKVIDTMKGMSYEGQCLTGKALAVGIKLKQKLMYVADKKTQSVHVLENIFYQSAYVVLPCKINGTEPVYLLKENFLECKVVVEDVFVKSINRRRIFKNVCLHISARISPTYEVCCSMHCNSKKNDIFIMHGNGNHIVNLTPGEYQKNYKPVWSPLGRDIAFISDDFGKKIMNVYSVNRNVTNQLSETGKFQDLGSYCWSEDSTGIFFSGRRNGCWEIYEVSSDNTAIRKITHGKGVYRSYRPKCSGTGGKIAFLRSVSGLTDIWIASTMGTECLQITSCGYVKSFDWAPDGRRIVYICSDCERADKVFIIDSDGGNNEEIIMEKPILFKKKVQISPDGSSFAFIGSRPGSADLFVYSFYDRNLTNITNYGDNIDICDFTWGADSDKICYAADELSYYCIYEIYPDCGHKMQLTNTMASKIELDYRPKLY